MGSHAFIAIDGFPIESTKNHFHQWYFRRSDRRIVEGKVSGRNQLFWGTRDLDTADEIEMYYIFEASAQTIRRRLELAGYTRAALNKEFEESIALRLDYAQAHYAKYGEFGQDLAPLQSASLDDWLLKLKQIIDLSLIHI